MRQHPAIGYSIVTRAIGETPSYAHIILEHHERLDGSGYPAGRKSSQLALDSQLVAIADAFDALTSMHGNQPGMSPYAACQQLRFGMPGQFNDESFKVVDNLLDPWAHPQDACYQTVQGLEALSAGGLFGIGLGNDRIFVPQDVNDFIFSVIAQELGLAGGTVVIVLFVAFAYAGFRTALRAPDTFGGLMAAGITAWICFQAIINIGVVVLLVPVTGITLPFVSAGGSSLTVSLAAVGILLSISRESVERGWISASADSGRGYGGTYLPGSRRRSVASS